MSNNNFYLPLREDLSAVIHNDSQVKAMNNMNNSNTARIQPNNSILLTPLNTQNQNRSRSPSPTRPFLPNVPMARMETDEESDDREVVNKAYPGVDDGFFSNGDTGVTNKRRPTPPQDSANPEVEFIPTQSKDPEETNHEYPHVPGISSRAGGDGDSENPDDTTDSNKPPTEAPKAPPQDNNPDPFPGSPGFRPWGWDLEVGNTLPSGETIPDLNVYQHKKTLAQGMMDLALFSANANQLRYVLETFKTHPYYYPSVVLIAISLMLQVGVGIGLIWNATYNVRDKKALCIANKVNNFTIIGVFLVTVINVFISAFGVAPAPP